MRLYYSWNKQHPEAGISVICTLHRPSAEVFAKFDRVVMLKRGGHTLFFGVVGENATKLRGYFESSGGQTTKEKIDEVTRI